MRMLVILLVALVTAAATFCAPSPAEAVKSPFITFLSNKACEGNPAAFKDGCDGYLKNRINKCKSAGEALSACLTWCNYYDNQGQPQAANKCREGCQFLNSKE